MKRRVPVIAPGVIGLDLSLRAAALCYIPPFWDGLELGKIRMLRLGYEIKAATEAQQVERYCNIAEGIAKFCREEHARGRSLAIYVEDYAYGMRSSSAHRLPELRGVVKRELWRDLPRPSAMEAVPISTGRKTLLQKLPRADVKDFVEENVRRLKAETQYWTGDEIDAFCVANHGRAVLGLPYMTFRGL